MSDDGFKDRLRQLLSERSLSTRDLAQKVGKSQAAVSKWLCGGNIENATLAEVAKQLQVDPLWLRFGVQRTSGTNRRDTTPVGDARRRYVAELMDQAHRAALIQRFSGVMWELNPVTNALVFYGQPETEQEPRVRYLENWVARMPGAEARQILERAGRLLIDSELNRLVFDYPIEAPDGRRRWMRACGGVERDSEGRPLRVVGISTDITDLKVSHTED